MLIRSQDRKVISNISNIESISVENHSDNKFSVRTHSNGNHTEKSLLGVYSTENRAIEVLDEICCRYMKTGVFLMPEE